MTMTKNPSGPRRPKRASLAYASHERRKDGSDVVKLGNLRVLITKHDGCWLAQGLEIDYAIDGDSPETAQRRFEEGLALTVESHLRVYSDISELLRVAPQDVWQKFFAVTPPDLRGQTKLITVRFSRRLQQLLPFDGISYRRAA
jgi:hypothetical protein